MLHMHMSTCEHKHGHKFVGLGKWDDYSAAIEETLRRTHTGAAPWTVIRSDDKKRARVGAIRTVLSRLDYDGKDAGAAQPPDPRIVGGPEIWTPG